MIKLPGCHGTAARAAGGMRCKSAAAHSTVKGEVFSNCHCVPRMREGAEDRLNLQPGYPPGKKGIHLSVQGRSSADQCFLEQRVHFWGGRSCPFCSYPKRGNREEGERRGRQPTLGPKPPHWQRAEVHARERGKVPLDETRKFICGKGEII